MDDSKPLIERDEVEIWDRWWLPASLGGTVLVLAFATATHGVRPQPWQMGLFTFGILVGMLDGLGSLRVVSYGTILGPNEREDEAVARLFAWERARWRYGLALVVSFVVASILPLTRSDEAGLAAVLGPWLIYFVLWGFDLFRSLREAKRFFPPETAKSR